MLCIQLAAGSLHQMEQDDIPSFERRYRVLLLPVHDRGVLVETDCTRATILRPDLDRLLCRVHRQDLAQQCSLLRLTGTGGGQSQYVTQATRCGTAAQE